MPIPEAHHVWTMGPSTGVSTAVQLSGITGNLSVYVVTDASCTCSVQILSQPTSTGAPRVVESSGTFAAGTAQRWTVEGPVGYLVPRLKTINDTANSLVITVYGI